MPQHPEILQARQLRVRSAFLRLVSLSVQNDLILEMQRGDNLRIIADEILAPSLFVILNAMPIDGSWLTVGGRFGRVISNMLDEGTKLIEENVMPEDGDAVWLVRLTEQGRVTANFGRGHTSQQL